MRPITIQCPHCFSVTQIWLAIDDVGEMSQDCEVCCHPWYLYVWLDEYGDLHATIQDPN